ncbi:MAG: hypothetical protein R6U04_09755 [Bacteroidales bacterium]
MDSKTNNKTQDTIIISSQYGRKEIGKQKIIYCRSFSVGTLVYLKDGSHLLLKESIHVLKSYLQESEFFLVDEYHLINIRYIDAIFSNRILLVNGGKCNIEAKRRKELFTRIEHFYAMQY